MRALASLILAAAMAAVTLAQDYPRTDDQRAWNTPAAPFRIIGPIHYVGTFDLASYLITTPAGHLLMDSGLESSAGQIRASVEKLGFAIGDIRILLNTQAHFDHAAGLATLKRLTKARLLATPADAALLESGGKDDPLFGNTLTFPPVDVDAPLADGQPITLGDVTLTAHITPGHSKGTTTFTMRVREGGRELSVIFAGSTSVPNPDAVLKIGPRYPTIVDDYRRTFAFMKTLAPDVFLTQHASAFALHDKAARLQAGRTPHPFVDPEGYRAWLTRSEQSFLALLAPK